MRKQYNTSFETAKLAKEVGFRPTGLFGYISKFYNKNTKTLLGYGLTGKSKKEDLIYSPELWELEVWIRTNKKLSIETNVATDGTYSVEVFGFNNWKEYSLIPYDIQLDFPEHHSMPRFKTREEALEKGLFEALKTLK